MKITFIYPGITESGFSNRRGNEGSWMNHGLCSLSATLKKSGHTVSLIDLRTLTGWEHFESSVKDHAADVYGISVMSVDMAAASRCASIIKKVSRAPVVFGGPHPSIAPEETLRDSNVDYVVCGEGEISLIELIRDIAEGRPAARLIEGKRPDLEGLPFVDRELFSAREEPFVPFLKAPFVTIIAGRGCIYNCSYCQPAERKIFGPRVRRRSVANVIAELKELDAKYSFNSFMFHDDCLTEDKKWIEDFCDGYSNAGFRKQFVCQSRADLVCRNRQMVKMLREIGLELMIIGFETGSQRMLDFIGKGTSTAQNLEAAKICHELGIKIWANYMLGLPGETREESVMTAEMIREIKPYHCSPAYYTPHPGSRLFDFCDERGLSLIKKPEDYRRNIYEPKIKGIDYDFLKGVLYESVSYGQDSNASPVRQAANFLRKKGIPVKRPSIGKIKSAVWSARVFLRSLVARGRTDCIVLLSPAAVPDPSAVFVNMGAVKLAGNTWSATSTTNDAQIYLFNERGGTIDTAVFRRISFTMYSDTPVQGQFTWWLTDGRWQSAEHFTVYKGWIEYCFDLKEMATLGKSYGSDIRWEGRVSMLRLDPSEKEGVLTRIKDVMLSV